MVREMDLQTKIKQLEEVIRNLQNRADKFFMESIKAKARVYDVIFNDMEEPKQIELKSKIITLEAENKKLVQQRDKLKSQLRTTNVPDGKKQ